MNEKELAKALRGADWAAYGDSKFTRIQDLTASLDAMKPSEFGTPNAQRIWLLGSLFHKNISWDESFLLGLLPEGAFAERLDIATRWVGAYLWVHGVRLKHAQVAEYILAGPEVGVKILWEKIDAVAP